MPLNTQQASRTNYLRTTQQKRRAEQARLQQVPHFGAASSGFMGEHDYLQALNEDAELAEAEGGPLRSLVNYGAPGMRQARPGVGSNSLGGDEEDPMDKGIRQGLATQEFQRGRVAMDEYTNDKFDRAAKGAMPTGRRALDLGYTADTTRKTGDIVRSENAENARAEASSFMDPRVREARGLENSEQEALLTARYGREADANAKVEAARIGAQAKVDSAGLTAGGNQSRAAIQQLVKSREAQLFGSTPPTPQQTKELEDLLLSQALGGGGGRQQTAAPVDEASFQALLAGAIDNGPGADQLAAHWDELTPEQQQVARQRLGAR